RASCSTSQESWRPQSSCVRRGRACGVRALAEVRLQTPEVVEMLARPEQNERGLHSFLVATASGLAHAREKAAAALGVSDMGRRHAAAVHERVPECDVPRLESVELAVEILAAALESRLAVGHAPERGERLR